MKPLHQIGELANLNIPEMIRAAIVRHHMDGHRLRLRLTPKNGIPRFEVFKYNRWYGKDMWDEITPDYMQTAAQTKAQAALFKMSMLELVGRAHK